MASTFSDLGIELMATGENAGTWGTKTNTNLQIVEKAIAGYVEKSIAGSSATTALTITDGDTIIDPEFDELSPVAPVSSIA